MIIGRACDVDGLEVRGLESPQAVPIGRGDRVERGEGWGRGRGMV